MFVHEKAGLILTEEISRKKSNFCNSQSGNGSNPAKKKGAFQSTHIFMHAVHIILITIFTGLQNTVFKWIPLSLYTYSPDVCHRFYISN